MIAADEETIRGAMPLVESARLLHELQVHRIELEEQNHELHRSQCELEASHARYFELFDMAPVGYLTLDEQGIILEANLTVATMLGIARGALLNTVFINHILPEDQCFCRRQCTQLADSAMLHQWDTRMVHFDGSPVWVELKATPTRNGECWVVVADIGKRKHAELLLHYQSMEEIGKYAEQYRGLIATNLFGFWQVDEQGKILEVNDTYCKMSGYTREELLQLSIRDVDVVLSAEEISREIEYLIAYDTDQFETRHRAKNGRIYDVEVNVTYLAAQKKMISFIRDISDRKQAEVALLESEARYHAIVNDQTELICRYRPDGRLSFVNEAYLRCFNKKREELINLNFIPHIPEPDLSMVMEQLKGITPGTPIVNVEHRVIMSDGMVRWQHWIHRGIYARGEGIVEYQAVGRDITKRKHVEEVLKEKKAKLKAYMDNSFDVIFVLNAEGVFMFVSKAWERHFGFPIKDVLNNKFENYVHPDDILPCTRYLGQILRSGRSKTSPPYRVKRSDGSWRRFIANGSRYLAAHDEWQFIGVAHDITDQYEAEENMRQAKAAAEAANHAKSAFLATMSHEIRTPLNALFGNIELLAESQLAPRQREYLKDCQTASQMLLQVINDVLDFSKIEAGKLELFNEPFSVSSMARQQVRLFAGAAEQKGLDLTLLLADGLPAHISGDQYRLRQIISNLLSNAIKFTDCGAVSLEVGWEHASLPPSPDRVVLSISVRDTGIGIPLGKQALIFDSFTQVEEFSTRRHAGTGLGLAICRRLAEMMEGSISLSSEHGEGSLFTLSLPVAVCQPLQLPGEQRATERTVTSRHILLADDEELGRSVTTALLQRRGHRVTAVSDGNALLEALQRQKFDIVISDISMPEMDGIEVARIIRSGERAGIDTLIPIIAMTAHAFAQDRARFLANGINGYAAKPVCFEELLLQIDELCNRVAEDSAAGQ